MERRCEQRERERERERQRERERERERERAGGIMTSFFCHFSWNFTVADMDLSVVEGIEGSEFNCGVSPAFSKLRFQVDTLGGVLSATDRYTPTVLSLNVAGKTFVLSHDVTQ